MHSTYAVIDRILADYLSKDGLPYKWLLAQTLATSIVRRTALEHLKLAHVSVADVGAGYGATCFELAALYPVQVDAVDRDATLLRWSQAMALDIKNNHGFHPLSTITFVKADACDLPWDSSSRDVVISRFLLQHLANPSSALNEWFRVLKPGGLLCVMDTDDGLSISYPPYNDSAVARLRDAIRTLQRLNGGDRFIGRRLAHLAHQAGFTIEQTIVLPQATFSSPSTHTLEVNILLEQVQQYREDLVYHGLLGEAELQALCSSTSEEILDWQFSTSNEIIIIARKPA
ncbi:class I SAM-dependent methyltransferase [Alicyclobacillus mali (ex Roth et al. 2021)]|uniref:class I SAM-dependent methyltransferase n=1 Tax=Alicyclobacillus mali (ex Roth et al. 2021) TaxID=1123961 RepID=UPI001A8DEBD3|nr:methyltransferase domain-containing protein [Alicyclobacillus mali (ex Roth et al. 2021)]